jgi:predicted nucleic acid-binding protein
MARPEKVVVDASVALKWYVTENWTEEALQMVDDYQKGKIDIASVTLMPFEVLNALRYAQGTNIMELQKVARSLEKLCMDLHQLEGQLSMRTMENALRYGITIYDSSYLSLGETQDAEVYTADMGLLRKTPETRLKPISSYLPRS